MDLTLATGLLGSVCVVVGAAWPDKPGSQTHRTSVKNWLLASGGVIMLTYALLGYLQGGPIFFVFLEAMIVVASILMMLDTDERIDVAILGVVGLGLAGASLFLFEGYRTLLFVIGLVAIGLGYTFETGSLRRDVCFCVGRALIALFSYLQASWVFFWLNLVSTVFASAYLPRHFRRNEPPISG
jgi:hypothetical protein